MEKFTPIEKLMLDVLKDGERHKREELWKCLDDELSPIANIQKHITNMRKKLRPKGQEIVCEVYLGSLYYRQVRLLVSPSSNRS